MNELDIITSSLDGYVEKASLLRRVGHGVVAKLKSARSWLSENAAALTGVAIMGGGIAAIAIAGMVSTKETTRTCKLLYEGAVTHADTVEVAALDQGRCFHKLGK